MFMERGEVAKAQDQIKGHPQILKEIEAEEKPKEETKSKGKK